MNMRRRSGWPLNLMPKRSKTSRSCQLLPAHTETEEDPSVDSSVSVWAGNNWHEREVFDLFGIKFKGHPDLRRMFMQKTFEGHALRKDYPKDRRQPLARREGLV